MLGQNINMRSRVHSPFRPKKSKYTQGVSSCFCVQIFWSPQNAFLICIEL